jgi:antitoxin (DNA-binding transcriptional repressor) of toxin-antitoxin stability system
MAAISIDELHEHTDLWVRRAAEEPVILTDGGQAVAKIVPVAAPPKDNPFLTRQLLPGFAELQAKLAGGSDSTQIISEMRDGR